MTGKTKPKKFIFVLMPFDSSFDDTYTYGIKQTCQELGAYCERVDEQIFSERILDRIYNQIAKADLIIADMTERNANVFYEVGYAHGLNKNVILLTRKADDIPFDLKHFPHIIYDGQIKLLSTQLSKKIEWFLSNNLEEDELIDFGMDFFLNGVRVEEGKEIELGGSSHESDVFNPAGNGNWSVEVQVAIHNNSSRYYKPNFKIGFELEKPETLQIVGLESILLENNRQLFISKVFSELYPGSYRHFKFIIRHFNNELIALETKFKVFTNFEMKETQILLKIPSYGSQES